MSKSNGRFDVFDFDEEEELVPKESAKITKRFTKPLKFDASPVTKYTFLESFAVKENKPLTKGTIVVPSVSNESKTAQNDCIDVYSSGGKSWSESSHPRESTPSSRSSGFILDKDEGKHTKYSSMSTLNFTSTEPKSSSEQSKEFDVRSWKSDTVNKKVVVSPDSLMHGNIYCTNSILTFTPNTIKLMGSFVDQTKETVTIEWPVSIILKIESQWYQDVETAIIKIYFHVEGMAFSIDHGLSGGTLLKFTVCDSAWFQGEEAIKSLDTKYKNSWNVIYDIDSVSEDNELPGTNSPREKENCLNGEAIKALVFPKGERDAVSIGLRDMELLQPETFINDTIIDFYMKYLATQIPLERRNRFYFFNSFFFRKLADVDKGSNDKSERQEAFQRVRKWTRNVNLFEKDYIFIPVNFSLHWSLIIICHPGELVKTDDYVNDKSGKYTRILHMDSLRGCHRGLKNLFVSYLKEELRMRLSETAEVVALEPLNIEFISLEVPQQQNSFDCGLFLLHYVERFLQLSSVCFNPDASIGRDWFTPLEVSSKRSYIRELFHKILLDDCDYRKEGDHISTVSHHHQNQTESDTKIEEACSSADISGAKDLSCTSNDVSLTSGAKQVNYGASSGLLTPEQSDTLRHTVSKFCSEVAGKLSDRISSYPNRDSKSLRGKAKEASTSYSSKIINSLWTSWNTKLSSLQGMNNHKKMSSNGSPNLSVAEVHIDMLDQPTADLNKENNSKFHSTVVEDLEDNIVQDSEDEDIHAVSCGGNGRRAIVPFCSASGRTNLLDCVVQDSESDDELEHILYEEKDIIDVEDSNKSFKVVDLSNEADEYDARPPAKKPRRKLDR